MRGGYLEAAHPLLPFPSPREVGGLRDGTERFRHAAQDAARAISRFRHSTARRGVVGISYFPDPDVVVKVDYTVGKNQSSVFTVPRTFNVGLGWWF